MPKPPRRRNGFYYRDNDLAHPYVSVTKVLQDVINKPALTHWLSKQASDIALRDPYLNTDEVMALLKDQQRLNQERGKAVHDVAEILAWGGPYIPNPQYQGYCDALYTWWQRNEPEPIEGGIEREVFNDRLESAGRLDLLCKIRGKTCLIDWKTGSAIYRESGLQLAFYKGTIEEYEGREVDRTIVVLCTPTGEPVEKNTNDELWEYENVLEVWKWQKKRPM